MKPRVHGDAADILFLDACCHLWHLTAAEAPPDGAQGPTVATLHLHLKK